MPLDNNAKIGDIITSLEGMQGINQKAELASVIGNPAIASDNIATQITKLQSAKDTLATKMGVENTIPIQEMADNLVMGKKWASGTVVNNASASFSNHQNQAESKPFVEVVGLNFTPSTVLIIAETHSPIYYTAVSKLLPKYSDYTIISVGGSFYRLTGNAYINNNGFKLPVYYASITYFWLAYE